MDQLGSLVVVLGGSKNTQITLNLAANSQLKNVDVTGTNGAAATVTVNGLRTADEVGLQARDSAVALQLPNLEHVRQEMELKAENQATASLIGLATGQM